MDRSCVREAPHEVETSAKVTPDRPPCGPGWWIDGNWYPAGESPASDPSALRDIVD